MDFGSSREMIVEPSPLIPKSSCADESEIGKVEIRNVDELNFADSNDSSSDSNPSLTLFPKEVRIVIKEECRVEVKVVDETCVEVEVCGDPVKTVKEV